MVKQADIHQAQSALQMGGQVLIGCRRVGNPTGVVVRKDDCGRIVVEGTADNFPRIDAGLGQCAPKEFFTGNEPITSVQPEGMKDLIATVGQAQFEIAPYMVGRRQGDTLHQLFAQGAPGQFQNGDELRCFGREGLAPVFL